MVEHKAFAQQIWNHDEHQQYYVQCNQLKKVYKDGVAAVNENTFCVKKGEVFGLLGPNGAGKSSMFNIVTMDLKRTSGDMKIAHTNLD